MWKHISHVEAFHISHVEAYFSCYGHAASLIWMQQSLGVTAGYRVNFLRCEASLFKDRECPIFYGHGRKVDMILFVGEIPLFVGEIPLFVGENPLFVGEIPLFVGENPLFVGEIPLFVGEVPLFVGEIPDQNCW